MCDTYEGKRLIPHAYSGRMDFSSISVLPGTEEIGDYAFSECRRLREIVIPPSVKRIGRHAFYNCRGLKKLVISGSLNELEEGAFKNCHALDFIEIEDAIREHWNVKKLLHEIEQKVELFLHFSETKEMVKLVVPAYHYEYLANEPARIISEVSYGSGFYFRECLKQEEPKLAEYDSYFPIAVREEDFAIVAALAEGRIFFPYHLTEYAEQTYCTWLREHIIQLTSYHANREEVEILSELIMAGVYSPEVLEEALEAASKTGKVSCISVLMNYKHQAAGEIKKEYDL